MSLLTAKNGWRVIFAAKKESRDDEFVKKIKERLQKETADMGALLEIESHAGKTTFESSTTDLCVSFGDPGVHSFDFIAECSRLMRPSAALCLFEPAEGRTFADSAQLNENLTLSGFIDVRVGDECGSSTWLMITARAPTWVQGAALSLKTGSAASSVPLPGAANKKQKTPPAPPNVWSNIKADEDDVMDESDLLTADDVTGKPAVQAEGCDPATSKRACKNCTCGRAEEEAAGEAGETRRLTLAMLENPGIDSSCGSCALGDAYRCAGCPYRGLPSFTPGQKIQLPDNFLAPDI